MGCEKRQKVAIPIIWGQRPVDYKTCFEGDKMLENRESYARYALQLFSHYRTIEDLRINGSFWECLKQIPFFGQRGMIFYRICKIKWMPSK